MTNNIIYTSGSKISGIQSKRLAIHAFYKLRQRVNSLKQYAERYRETVYGYEFTVNPSKLTCKNVADVNRKIIHNLKKNAPVALIQKAVEHTYYRCEINLHLHYLVVTTGRINLRKTYRIIKNAAKQSTHGMVNQASNCKKPYRRVTNWTKAEDYVTKQRGKFPLMMIHHQWQRFMAYPKSERLALLAEDYNESKGMETHRFYVNNRNIVAKKWHKALINKRYCKKNGTLVHVRRNTAQNCHLTNYRKLSDQTRNRSRKSLKRGYSKHHYSEMESISVFHGNGVYGIENQRQTSKQMALF